jgi:hypothetical protein
MIKKTIKEFSVMKNLNFLHENRKFAIVTNEKPENKNIYDAREYISDSERFDDGYYYHNKEIKTTVTPTNIKKGEAEMHNINYGKADSDKITVIKIKKEISIDDLSPWQ